jgi:hypothetical protein
MHKGFVRRTLESGVAGLLAIVLILVLWYKASPTIVTILDFNLALVKFLCSLLGARYGPMIEVALRGGLGFDKVLLFSEAILLVKGLMFAAGRILLPKRS